MKTIDKISKWHMDRGITINGSSNTQTMKLVEEVGELCAAKVRENKEGIKDAIGDIIVVLVALSELEGFTLQECVDSAYNEIKDRKGKLLANGNFVKDEDLK